MNYTNYRAAFRGSRATPTSNVVPEPGAPVGPGGMSVEDEFEMRAAEQAEQLKKGRTGPAGWQELRDDDRAAVQSAYGSGGFDAVKQVKDWYSLPAHVRTQILAGASGRMG